MNPGQYQGQAIKGTVQYGETDNGTLQIAIDMEVFDDKDQSIGSMTTFLYFSPAAAVYSFERLRALGWKGETAEDVDKLDDIFDTKVPVRITAPKSYTASDGTTKMGTSKLEILSGGSRVTLQKPVDVSTFKARLKAVSGGASGGGGTTASAGGGGTAPPF